MCIIAPFFCFEKCIIAPYFNVPALNSLMRGSSARFEPVQYVINLTIHITAKIDHPNSEIIGLVTDKIYFSIKAIAPTKISVVKSKKQRHEINPLKSSYIRSETNGNRDYRPIFRWPPKTVTSSTTVKPTMG